MECVDCGGTDFYKESGYFYCSECQTQSQEIQENVFQEETTNVKAYKRIKTTPKIDKIENNITSWECYNVVMASLTQQLINLGADRSLKQVVKCLWLKYLEKLEVINFKYDEKPKLPLVNSKRDFEILYGPKKKRKRKKSTSDESSTVHSTSVRRERTKKKTKLAQAQYVKFSQQSSQETASLHTETLASVKSSSDRTINANTNIRFNRYSVSELRKKISVRHLKKHKVDHSRNLTCHKFTYKNCSKVYKNGIHFLSPVKLYCILYLGLLITKDRIQLGDLFRFIREGHLSFNNFTQLFPEGYSDKFLNIRNNLKNSLFTNKYFRVTTAKLATFLKVTTYIRIPDLVELTKRYCKEMNLPDDFFLSVTNILSKTNVKLKMTKVGKIIPNYEGRVMSLILFTFKLLFGVDGKSEDHLSKYAQLINELHLCEQSMFDIKKWMIYIEYRNLILSEYHFPTHDTSNSKVDSNLFLQYMKSHNIEYDENAKLTREMKDYKEILTRIKSLQNDFTTHLEYPASLTPFRNHIEVVLKWINRPMSKEVLEHNFEKESLDFLLKPNEYLLTLNSSVIVKHRGANNNWIMEDIKTKRTVKNITCKNRHLVPVKIVSSVADEDMKYPIDSAEPTPVKNVSPQYVQKQYQKCRRHVFMNNARYIRKFCKSINIDLTEMDKNVSYSVHFNPYERYWFYLQMNIDLINKSEFDEFFNKNTNNFKIVFKECARIIEQNFQELYTELQFTELYLVFSANFDNQKNVPKPKRWLTEKLGFYVDQAETMW